MRTHEHTNAYVTHLGSKDKECESFIISTQDVQEYDYVLRVEDDKIYVQDVQVYQGVKTIQTFRRSQDVHMKSVRTLVTEESMRLVNKQVQTFRHVSENKRQDVQTSS